jgi:hypothetical protein
MTATAIMPSSGLATPETYLDPARAQLAQKLQKGTHDYPGVTHPRLNQFALAGPWTGLSQSITPAAASGNIIGRFQAQNVYLVMTSADNTPRKVKILVDGKPITKAQSGADVHHGMVTVTGQRLYSLVSAKTDEMATITVEVPHGVQAYDFTFG